MRTPIIAGNWKMNKDMQSAKELARGLVSKNARFRDREIILFPPYPFLPAVAGLCQDSRLEVGAQDISEHEAGAFTGEVSAEMVVSTGATWTIAGHSERRNYHLETDEIVNNKVKRALSAGLNVILCVGENLRERERGAAFDVVQRQTERGLAGLDQDAMGHVVLAYEPLWAIGTGKTATPRQAQEIHEFLRWVIQRMFDNATAEDLRILYGGSVKPGNINGLMAQKDIDGALVGGASLDVESFSAIINFEV